MSERRRLPQEGRVVAPARPPGQMTAHDLCNVIGALQLRFGVLESDPTCRWAQEENLIAMRELLKEGMRLARALESAASVVAPTPLPIATSRHAPGRHNRPVTARRR